LPERLAAVNQCQLIGASLLEGSKKRSGKIRETRIEQDVTAAHSPRIAQNAAMQCEARTVLGKPGTPPARGCNAGLRCEVRIFVSMLAGGSRQKSRLLPAATKPLSEKSASATFFQ
jgi:hypothetical protein